MTILTIYLDRSLRDLSFPPLKPIVSHVFVTLPQQKLKIFQNFKNLSPPRELTLEQNKDHFCEKLPGIYKVMYYL